MGLARTPPPQAASRSSSAAPHHTSPTRNRTAESNDLALPSSAQTALRPPSSVLRPRSPNEDEGDLFAKIAPSSSPIKPAAIEPASARSSLNRAAESHIASQFQDAPASHAGESQFRDATEQQGASDVFARRSKLARSPPRALAPQPEPELDEEADAMEEAAEAGGEPEVVMEETVLVEAVLEEAVMEEAVMEETAPAAEAELDLMDFDEPATVTEVQEPVVEAVAEAAPRPTDGSRFGGYKGLAMALFGRQADQAQGKPRQSLPNLHGKGSDSSPSGSAGSKETLTTTDMSRTFSQPTNPAAAGTLGMARSSSLGTLSQLAKGTGPPLTMQDAVSSIAKVRVQLNEARNACQSEARKRRDAETFAKDLEEEVQELRESLAEVQAQLPGGEATAAAEKDGIRISPEEYESLVASLSSIPALQSTIARLRFRDARRMVEASHQRWHRKWQLQWGEVDEETVSEAVRKERVELVKSRWREEDVKGKLAEVEWELFKEKARREEGMDREKVLKDQQEALAEELAQERQVWKARQAKAEKAEEEVRRLKGELEESREEKKVGRSEEAKKAEDGKKKALAEAAKLRAELESAQETIDELQTSLGKASKKAGKSGEGGNSGKLQEQVAQLKADLVKWEKRGEKWSEDKAKLQDKVKEQKAKPGRTTSKGTTSITDRTIVEDSQPAKPADPSSDEETTRPSKKVGGGRQAAQAARAALVESDEDEVEAPVSAGEGSEDEEDSPPPRKLVEAKPVKNAKADKGAEDYEEKKRPAAAKPKARSETDKRPAKLLVEKTNGASAAPAKGLGGSVLGKGKRKAEEREEEEGEKGKKGGEGDGKKKRKIFGAKGTTSFAWSTTDDNALGLPPELSPIKKALPGFGGGGGSQSFGKSILGLGRAGSVFGR